MADCPHSSAPGDEELLLYREEETSLPEEKRAHLEQCVVCQQRLAAYTQLDEMLVRRFYRSFCPGSIQISLYCEDLLGIEERTSIANHILDCPLCAAEVTSTRRFMRDTSLEVKVSPLRATRRIFGILTKQQAQSVLPIREREHVAENILPRQYRAGALDLSLHLSRTGGGEQVLLGILTSIDSAESVEIFEGEVAELYPGSSFADLEQQMVLEPFRWTKIDDLGNLVFRDVLKGDYVLIIHLPEQDIVIEQISIE